VGGREAPGTVTKAALKLQPKDSAPPPFFNPKSEIQNPK
jgi:hypothetical protein